MKRHSALQDLSRDHFHVLFRCQQFRRALKDGVDVRPLIKEFLAFFRSDMSPHFDEEDELVIPLAQTIDKLADVSKQTLVEHRQLRQWIAELERADTAEDARERLRELEPKITAHVHMEEAELFEGVQAHVDEQRLKQLSQASIAFRTRRRGPGSIGPHSGRG